MGQLYHNYLFGLVAVVVVVAAPPTVLAFSFFGTSSACRCLQCLPACVCLGGWWEDDRLYFDAGRAEGNAQVNCDCKHFLSFCYIHSIVVWHNGIARHRCVSDDVNIVAGGSVHPLARPPAGPPAMNRVTKRRGTPSQCSVYGRAGIDEWTNPRRWAIIQHPSVYVHFV